MELNNKQLKHCDLVRISGRIDSSTAPTLQSTLDQLTEDGRYKIVLDFSGVEFISSAGLRVLINTQKACKRYNRGEVILASLSPVIHSALDLAGFLPLFRVEEDATSAVGSF